MDSAWFGHCNLATGNKQTAGTLDREYGPEKFNAFVHDSQAMSRPANSFGEDRGMVLFKALGLAAMTAALSMILTGCTIGGNVPSKQPNDISSPGEYDDAPWDDGLGRNDDGFGRNPAGGPDDGVGFPHPGPGDGDGPEIGDRRAVSRRLTRHSWCSVINDPQGPRLHRLVFRRGPGWDFNREIFVTDPSGQPLQLVARFDGGWRLGEETLSFDAGPSGGERVRYELLANGREVLKLTMTSPPYATACYEVCR